MKRAWLAVAIVAVLTAGALAYLLSAPHDRQTPAQLHAMQSQLEEARKRAAAIEAAKKSEERALEAERSRMAAEKAAAEKSAAQAKAAAEKPAPAMAAASRPGGPAAPAGSAGAFEMAHAFEQQGEGRQAIRAYTQAARGGSCEAAKRLGEIYDRGQLGVARDYAESLKWYNFARALATCDVPMPARREAGGASPPVTMERYPTIESPDRVRPEQTFVVQVSLTEEQLTSDVRARRAPGVGKGSSGALQLPLPGDRAAWTIDVVLTARGFDFVDGSNAARITLPRRGDSTPAVFTLKADPQYAGEAQRRIYATLSHEGQYLVRLSREIRVGEAADAAPLALRSPLAVNLAATRQPADLTLVVLDQADAGKAGTLDVIVLSPYLQPERETLVRAGDAEQWVRLHYQKIVEAVAQAPGGKLAERTIPLLDGFGAQLYDGFAPPAFRRAYARLEKVRGARFDSIQVITNNPALPWELMRPLGADGKRQDFLGARHRVARWHLESTGLELPAPVQAIALDEIVAIAPRYKGAGALGAQTRELDALRRLRGARVVDGRLKTVSELFERRPAGIVHFAGHGAAAATASGIPDYVIQLEDATLDVTSWRGLAQGPIGSGALVFFNACDVGQASRVARFVEGWAPALLEAGASGYIGGLWPLTDEGAADFAVRFYAALGERGGGSVLVADVLRQNRRLFRDSGDPTYLAYVLYGDVNLHIDRR